MNINIMKNYLIQIEEIQNNVDKLIKKIIYDKVKIS
jgi:hypothetical protein